MWERLPKGECILAKKKDLAINKEYTLMVVPHNGKEVRSVRIPMLAVMLTASILCLLMVFMAGSFINYRNTMSAAVSSASAEKAELESLRKNNGAQVEQIEQLAKTTATMQADMERLNSLDAEVRHIVNNEDTANTSRAGLVRPSGTFTGKGGPVVQSDINDIKNVVNDLQAAITEREQSLLQLKQELLAKQARLGAVPSVWPTSGDVTSRFGWRDLNGKREFHPGIDIANSIGTPIVATAAGEVVRSSDDGDGYGKMVQIDHGNGIVTIYGHNSQTLVQVGQSVKKGQLIAYLGSSGYSTGPHSHYEIRVNGTAVNPASFLN
jgi:murein DD-endopeptidase MepM/ murein hydrolase activator NlpD